MRLADVRRRWRWPPGGRRRALLAGYAEVLDATRNPSSLDDDVSLRRVHARLDRRHRVGNQPSFVCAHANDPPLLQRRRARLLSGGNLGAETQPRNRIADRGVGRPLEAFEVDE